MTTGRIGQLLAAGTFGLLTGCVDRRFVVDTNAPGAQISVDGKPIGPSPADAWYVYPGKYEFKAVAPGYQPLTRTVRLKPKWYDYPGLDFFAEVLWPFRIEDVRHVQLELEPARPVQTDQLLENADALRARGLTLPPQSVPEDATPGPAGGPPVTQPRIVTPGPDRNADTFTPPTGSPDQLPRLPAGSDPQAMFPPPAAPTGAPLSGVSPPLSSPNR